MAASGSFPFLKMPPSPSISTLLQKQPPVESPCPDPNKGLPPCIEATSSASAASARTTCSAAVATSRCNSADRRIPRRALHAGDEKARGDGELLAASFLAQKRFNRRKNVAHLASKVAAQCIPSHGCRTVHDQVMDQPHSMAIHDDDDDDDDDDDAGGGGGGGGGDDDDDAGEEESSSLDFGRIVASMSLSPEALVGIEPRIMPTKLAAHDRKEPHGTSGIGRGAQSCMGRSCEAHSDSMTGEYCEAGHIIDAIAGDGANEAGHITIDAIADDDANEAGHMIDAIADDYDDDVNEHGRIIDAVAEDEYANEAGGIEFMIEPSICSKLAIDASDSSFWGTLEHARMGLEAGHSPEPAMDGSGGVYFMKDGSGSRNVAVFKPMDEEPMCENNPKGYCNNNNNNRSSSSKKDHASESVEGLKKGTKIGEGAIKEVAAYILDRGIASMKQKKKKQKEKKKKKDEDEDEDGDGDGLLPFLGFSGVPPTIMARCFHQVFNYGAGGRAPKIGSIQRFVESVGNCVDMSPSLFSVHEVHKITVLDLRLANTDRHGGNILVSKHADGGLELVPIDHGYCFPDKFGECTFEWLYWPQASRRYEESTLQHIEALDADRDIELLKRRGWSSLRPQCARVLRISMLVLKAGASAGLTPFQIGSILSCNRCSGADACKAPIELILEEAQLHIMDHRSSPLDDANETHFMHVVDKLLHDHIANVKLLG